MNATQAADASALAQARPADMDPAEWFARIELAALYRLFDAFGWTELVFNHISLRVPGTDHAFLMNPYGLWYSEVTARNLVKVRPDGQAVDGESGPVNPAGFVIHGAIHAARADAACVIHTHTTAGCAVAAKAEGLRCDNFYSVALAGQVAYHDFEGLTSSLDEQPRLVRSLGDKSLMILRNHGQLAIGPTIAQAFRQYWRLQRACEIQAVSDAMAGPPQPASAAALAASAARVEAFDPGRRFDQTVFDACLRRTGIRRIDLV